MDNNGILLSIFLPTYNRCELCRRQLEYLKIECEGLRDKVEIIVSDNCSDDGTKDMLSQYSDFCSYINRNDYNLGLLGNQYISAQICRGRYLWILSDDDQLKGGAVHHVINLLIEYTDINLIYLNFCGMNDKKRVPVYKGEKALYDKDVTMFLNDPWNFAFSITLTSAVILKRDYYIEATKILPLTTIKSNCVNMYAPLAAMKNGKSLFEKDIWISSGMETPSWVDRYYECVIRARIYFYADLKYVGFTKREVKMIYKCLCCMGKGNKGVIDPLVFRLLETRNFSTFLVDWIFLFRQCPGRWFYTSITFFLYIVSDCIKKLLKGDFKRADYSNHDRWGM